MKPWRRYLLGSLNVIQIIGFSVVIGAFVIALFPWSLAMLGVPLLIMFCRDVAKGRISDHGDS